MIILHYLHGMPPIYGGGLVNYALDLAKEQKNQGHCVDIIVPGRYVCDINNKYLEGSIEESRWEELVLYKINNTIPVTNGKAINPLELLYNELPNPELNNLLKIKLYDVIHIHSFMGLPMQLLKFAKELGITTVFTTHDYYGLCPNAILLQGDVQCEDNSGNKCAQCLGTPIGVRKLERKNNYIYVKLKQCHFWKWLEFSPTLITMKCLLMKLRVGKSVPKNIIQKDERYLELQKHYREMFSYIDIFHFNSWLSKDVYEQLLGPLNGEVIHVALKDISDHRILKQYAGKLKIGYIGRNTFKGFDLLKEALEILKSSGNDDFECQIYNNSKEVLPSYFKRYKPYSEDEKADVFGRMDVLVLPSVWKETFGLTVLEALSYGVPVVVTKYVGAKDIIESINNSGFVIESNSKDLANVLRELLNNRAILRRMNESICTSDWKFNYTKHVDKIIQLYRREKWKIQQ